MRNKQPGWKCNQGSTICAILTFRMGDHGVSWENMENIEDMENMNIWNWWFKTPHSWFKSLFLWFKTLHLSTLWLKTLYLLQRLKKSLDTRLENIILGQPKMGEHQTKCWALPVMSMNRKIVIHQSSMFTSFENLCNSAKVRTSLG